MRTYPIFYGPVSAVTDFTSPPIPIGDDANLTVGVFLTGADVVGSIQIQASMTEDFTQFFLLEAATAVTASADTLRQFSYVGVPWVRVFWDYTSGTGNATISISIAEPMLHRGG